MRKFLIVLFIILPFLLFSQTTASIVLSGQVPHSLHLSINTLTYMMNPLGASQEILGSFNIKSNSNNNVSIKIQSNNNFNLISRSTMDRWAYTIILVDSQGGEFVIDTDIELSISKLRMENFMLKASYSSYEELNLFSDLYEDYLTIILSSN